MIRNIVIVCDYVYVDGGAAKVAIQSAVALSKHTDYNVYFFGGSGEICDELKRSIVKVIALNMYDLVGNPSKIDAFIKGIYNRKAGLELEKLLDTINTEETVVHIHTWTKVLSSAVFKVCNKKNVRTFLTIHDYFLACPNGGCYNYCKKKICNIKPMSFKCICTDCDSRNYVFKVWRCLRQIKQNSVIRSFKNLRYIHISEFQKERILERGLDIRHSVLLRNPLDVNNRYRVDCVNNEAYVFIGRVCKEKGTDLFCEAIRKAKVKGIVVGDGPLLEELKSEYPEIEFTGWLNGEQKEEVIRKTRVLVFTSVWYEGSPLTVPEVQAYGIPCIVTDCSAAVDDIQNGINGLIVSTDAQDVAMAIDSLEDDDYLKKLSDNTFNNFNYSRAKEKIYISNLLNIYSLDNL